MKYLWLIIFFSVLVWSGINPKDYLTWVLEVFPALIGIIILGATFNKFRLTKLTYILILVHCIILMVGGHYTYAEVPLFDWIKNYFDLARNNYDKVGHLAQGFIPAIIAREILIRKEIVTKPKWLSFIVISICLAISAFYELIEWWVAELSGESAEAFLGTQGYIWDTQSDMALALLGAVLSLSILSRIHDKQLEEISLFGIQVVIKPSNKQNFIIWKSPPIKQQIFETLPNNFMEFPVFIENDEIGFIEVTHNWKGGFSYSYRKNLLDKDVLYVKFSGVLLLAASLLFMQKHIFTSGP